MHRLFRPAYIYSFPYLLHLPLPRPKASKPNDFHERMQLPSCNFSAAVLYYTSLTTANIMSVYRLRERHGYYFMKQTRKDVRNIAIIAHVDHGKTTLVDELLKQSGVFRENQEVAERVMDSNDIERERGITILSKNTAVIYKDTKINIIDTPGHADFGGEVERVLKMVNGVILVVDAFEGAMPQTKFVLRKALELQLPVIVCINKIDRPEARPREVIDEVLELFIDLDASEEQLDCPFIFASAKTGIASLDMDTRGKDMTPLFETILDYIPAPEGDPETGTQVLISTIDYNEYVGRIGVGKVDNGCVKVNQEVAIVNHHEPDKMKKVKISKLYEFDGLNKVDVKEAGIGSIVAISGIADIHIGDTLCSPDNPVPIPFQKISEPTIAMHFIVNDSPLAGREGKYVTSRHLRDRLFPIWPLTPLLSALTTTAAGRAPTGSISKSARSEGKTFACVIASMAAARAATAIST